MQKMTQKEIERARKKGRLGYKPRTYPVDGRERFRTSDGVEYKIRNGTVRGVIPRPKMSKQQRRKMRREMGV
jgi:hypothetical protein